MGKKKIKIRYIIFVLITMGVIFFGKITRLDNLNAEKIAGIILVSPPYKKRITGQQKIEEFTILFNDRKKKPVFSITPQMAGTKEPLYQWKHTNIILFFAWRTLR